MKNRYFWLWGVKPSLDVTGIYLHTTALSYKNMWSKNCVVDIVSLIGNIGIYILRIFLGKQSVFHEPQ